MILNKIYKYSDNKCINLSNLLYKSCKNYSLSNSNKKLNNTILFNENNKLKILNSNNNNKQLNNNNKKLNNNNKKLNNTILFNENNKLKIINSNNNNLKKIEMHESHSPTAYLIKN